MLNASFAALGAVGRRFESCRPEGFRTRQNFRNHIGIKIGDSPEIALVSLDFILVLGRSLSTNHEVAGSNPAGQGTFQTRLNSASPQPHPLAEKVGKGG